MSAVEHHFRSKLQVNFRKRAINYRALLRKMTSRDLHSEDNSRDAKRSGVATISRLLKITGLFCKRAL